MRQPASLLIKIIVAIALLFSASVTMESAVYGGCGDGVKVPAFLASGVAPNLLLMIDNSASMYDLAYIGNQGTCYDDAYSSNDLYVGYFDPGTWYNYNLGLQKFEAITDSASATSQCNASTYKATGQVGITISGTSVTGFIAKGNYLNWAASSKLDIEKKILTGGKYESSALIMESRGCLGRRYVKKTALTNSGGSVYYLTLGIRPPDPNEKENSLDTTTRIEIFKLTTTGFNNSACQSAINELQQPTPNQGQLKGYTDACMGYTENNAQNAFNHSLQNCWYLAKQGEWQPGNGSVQSAEQDCKKVYGDKAPALLVPEDQAYVCYGEWASDVNARKGYVGRCWHNSDWESDACVDAALKDYCGMIQVPEVVDPSDQVGITGDLWNIPAVLIDSGVIGQLSQPLLVIKGKIAVSAPPSGLIQEVAGDIRLGAMVFNIDGSKSECTQADPNILYRCTDAANKDGGLVISNIDLSTSHTTAIVSAINDIKATSWTPLAEAFYNAVGYYSQNASLRLDSSDFTISSDCDPIKGWCQNNNILIITDGGSTADLNPTVFSFAPSLHPDTDSSTGCDQLHGSTLLNDLTYYAKTSSSMYPVEQWAETVGGVRTKTKQNITTHIVVSGEARSAGSGDCNPQTLLQSSATNGGTSLYSASNPAELESRIRAAFSAIRSGTASGSAASVISSSRGGEGAIYQATFWPSAEGLGTAKIGWTGEVHALLINDQSEMFEDTNQNGMIDSGDLRVYVYYDSSARDSKACYGTLSSSGACTGTSKSLSEVKYLWSASKWLNDVSNTDILNNRSAYASSEKKRYIFTWNDINNDGIVTSSEILPFVDNVSGAPVDWYALVSSPDSVARGRVPLDFGLTTNDEVNKVVNWVRGQDQTGMRGRQVAFDSNNDGIKDAAKTWRLGDVIHSTPVPVSRPSEAYHLVYRDSSFARFANHYKNRRQVIYFGGNDGMVHAVNGGFYDSTNKKFCRSATCASESSNPELGAELWAYVPYNALPHLKCMTETDYQHRYFVDLQPRIFDVQIFDNDATHPHGWGTILVIGMGFGGSKVKPGELDSDGDHSPDYANDDREFTSSYMVFDITDPENPPTLLAESTRKKDSATVDFGFTTSVPAISVMKSGGNTSWYLILGTGPNLIEGQSTQRAKIAVLPLSWLTGASRKPFTIDDSPPSAASGEGGRFDLTDNSFVSDIVSVDFELTPEFKTDAVYFGTVQGSFDSGWGGKLSRLVTRKKESGSDGKLVRVATTPHQWTLAPLIDVSQPITAAPAIGYDGRNYWIYFGTGRFLDEREKSDTSQQSFYGIREPLDCDRNFTWGEVAKTGAHNGTPGGRGLLRTDQILVHQAYSGANAALSCNGGGSSCLPAGVSTFNDLLYYIVGSGCASPDPTGTDGWYIQFNQPRERNLGQSVLLGGLLTFSTYQPYNDLCLSEGLSYLYGTYYQTGTAWYEPVFGANGVTGDGNTVSIVPLGHGLSLQPNLHIGKKDGSTVFLQSSTGAILEIQQPNLPLKNSKTGKASWTINPK